LHYIFARKFLVIPTEGKEKDPEAHLSIYYEAYPELGFKRNHSAILCKND